MSAAGATVVIVTKDRREDILTAVACWLAKGTARIEEIEFVPPKALP